MFLEEKIKKAIEKYQGRDVKKIAVVQDPEVSGTYAIRSFGNTAGGCLPKHRDWLLVRVQPKDEIGKLCEMLEECEFTKWPPISGKPKFF